MEHKKITIIGAGNLGRSIAEGIVDKGVSKAQNITLTRRDLVHLSDLIQRGYKSTTNNPKAITGADIILLCVQPSQLDEVLAEINGSLTEDQLLISVITGV